MKMSEELATAAVVATVLFAGFKLAVNQRWVAVDGGITITRSNVEKPMIDPVREYFALRLRAAYGTARQERAVLKQASTWLNEKAQGELRKRLALAAEYDSGRGGVPEQTDLVSESVGDRLVWTNAAQLEGQQPLKLKVKNSKAEGVTSVDFHVQSADVEPTDGHKIILRRAQSGCRVLEGRTSSSRTMVTG